MAAETGQKSQGFKRINFFKGFLTTEHDWNDAERYHLEKRKLHNRLCHAPGIVPGYGGDLKIVARARGDLSIEVQPGYAIDGQGNDLVLWDAQIKTIVPEEYRLPQTLYVVLRYVEELTDFIAYKENLEYKGHRRVLEGCKVEISQTVPDIRQEVELGRILLDKGVTRVRDARDLNDPKSGEIDMRYSPKAGVAGSFLDAGSRIRVTQMLASAKKAFFYMARDGRVMTAHDALSAVMAASSLHAANQLDIRNIFEIMQTIAEMQAEVILDVEVNHPQVAQRKEFGDFRKQVEVLKGLISEKRITPESMQNLCGYQQKAADIVNSVFAGGPPVQVDEPKREAAPVLKEKKPSLDWEGVKQMSGNDLPTEVEVDGATWVLIDKIDVMDKDSEEAHQLVIHDAKDSYRSRQKLKYPDGTVIEDVGRAHVGGYTTFTVKNVTPGKPLMLIRRMDYVYGDYEIEYNVDGRNVGICSCAGTDRVNRWRNWPYLIPGEFITKNQAVVKQTAVTAGRDINMFKFWFYQPK